MHMQRPRRHRSVLRTALLVLLAFGLLVQPVLKALGELHDVEHAVAMQSDHGHPHHDGHEMPPGDDEAPGDAFGLHGLLHMCAPAAPMAPCEMAGVPAPLVATGDPPDGADASGAPTSRMTSPFRPPIA